MRNFNIYRFLFLGWAFLCFQNLYGQQVYPVHVSGTLIPPYSLFLSDYSNDRAQDIMFNVMLNDPIEESRGVRFRLSIINNGQEIMFTDPNYLPPPHILEQFIPELMDGIDLSAYLNPQNLVASNGGIGSNAIPEGFNQICLEVIDYERGVPISGKACVHGLFIKSQVPILNTPVCDALIPFPATQNRLRRRKD